MSRKRAYRRRWIGIVTIAMMMVAGHGTAADAPLEWTQIPEDQTKIVFHAPGLRGGVRKYYRSQDPGTFHSYQIGRWVGPSGRYPRAFLRLVELDPGYYFRDRSPVDETMEDMFGSEITIRKIIRYVNVLGNIYSVKFDKKTEKCVGFSQYYGNAESDVLATSSAGNAEILGYYCVDANKNLTSDEIIAVLKGIGVKGERVPVPPKSVMELGNSAIIDCLLPASSGTILTTNERCRVEGGKVLSPE